MRFLPLCFYLLVGCGPGFHMGPPPGSIQLDDKVNVNYNGTPRQDKEILIIVDVLRDFAFEKCGFKLYCFYFEVMPGPFECGSITATGCYPWGNQCIMQYTHNENILESSIVHEGLHYIFSMCGADSGGPVLHSQEFYNTLDVLKQRVAERFVE